jgi:hypothetical protein
MAEAEIVWHNAETEPPKNYPSKDDVSWLQDKASG